LLKEARAHLRFQRLEKTMRTVRDDASFRGWKTHSSTASVGGGMMRRTEVTPEQAVRPDKKFLANHMRQGPACQSATVHKRRRS
jgi:hypothetical protein